MIGYVHSFQSLGTLDGPGVRFVVFLQGCNLRCSCCHNPDTWVPAQGIQCTADEVLKKALHYREYFGKDGGITVSGGEPLLQTAFVMELFTLCRKEGLHTCLDTSGSIFNAEIKKLLSVTDRVLLDIKFTNENDYQKYVGCSMQTPLQSLDYLNEQHIPTTVRQVIIPTINDTAENISALKSILREHTCVDKIELLPFRKLCQMKYDKLGIQFPFSHLPEPAKESMQSLEALLTQ